MTSAAQRALASRPSRLLGLCGSLRRQSRSRALLDATGLLAPCSAVPDPVVFRTFDQLGQLPLFNPDEMALPTAHVLALWAAVDDADALVIASPEYAHGVTGTLKNALDWLVGYPPFADKPVAVFNPSHRADHADLSLKETLRTMAADLIPGACLRIPVTACDLSAPQLASSSPYRELITEALQAVGRHLRERSGSPGLQNRATEQGKHFDAKETA
ncbi:NADPH-dependent FMN reductase [Hydrogenophaga sp. SL48]|uniref:NADPH-dependent FMN reductase n=1 Tax=Hydrogenophaga sp. SL48 TaxID=2806347 RepID=UPI001F32E540|nr:NADPH-dependent FMN reductase [Hydrogenophaga sp. SL48]UJW80424.1 NAD(P)H-dependent oxidoreductase [Hydrogenophaga sp. SL48]